MKKHKSPGLDDIPPELLLAFWDLIGPSTNPLSTQFRSVISKKIKGLP